MNIISKIGTTPFTAAQRANEPPSPALSPSAKAQNAGVPPSLSTSALSISGTMDTTNMGLSENQLKRQGLECLVAVLRSLVVWGTAAGKTAVESHVDGSTRSQTGEEIRQDVVTPDPPLDRLSGGATSSETPRHTPDFTDDPTKFESAKQKKTTLLEGIKKFNFKPKRVC
jgi:brefeldin A-inhibited guanine nucleotide-exchange protein